MKNNLIDDLLMSLPQEISNQLETWVEASDSYYNTDEPLMSDEQFDELTEDLRLLSEKYPNILKIVNNKIQTKDGLVDAEEITSQMISLKKIKWTGLSTVNEIIRFLNPQRKNVENVYGLKLDGMAIKVSKQNEILIQTRGGQDFTEALKNHKDIINITRPITHGELVIKKSVFDEKYSVENGGEYENARNCILGVLKQNPNDLDFIECTDGVNPILESKIWKPFLNSIINYEQMYYEFKQTFEYQIDGIVVGHVVEQQEIKENYPMNLVAVKFKSPTATTKVVKINWTQKKTGNLTPIIEVQPVKLDGSTITNVAGYNYSNLKKAHIGIGSEIVITKSGDIIPVVQKVLSWSNNINMPEVEYIISGKHLIAVNQEESIIYKFILGLKLLNIDGIGPAIATQIGSVIDNDIVELFNQANKPKIIQVLGTGVIWQKLEQFYQIRNIGLDLLIELLQFNGCGKTLSKRFAEIILKESNDVSGIDKNVLNNVCKGDGFKKIQDSMLRLQQYGIKVTKPVKIDDSTISFEMTGTPPSGITKNEFIKQLKIQYPNSVHTTLTKETKYLFVDNLSSTSGKLNKARKYNTKIVLYSEALKGNLN